MMGDFDKTSDELQASLGKLVERHIGIMESTVGQAGSGVQQVRVYSVVLCIAGIALTLVVGAVTTLSIVNPLRFAETVAQNIAEGDLTQPIDAKPGGRSEVAHLLQAMVMMQANLRTMVTRVQLQVEEVSSVSSHLASANQDLSTRTDEQSTALQQTAVSMDELGGAVMQNSNNAENANSLALSASQVANSCGTLMEKVVGMMHELNTSSHRINDIVGVIDGIAFQTNILALNAAVEAARAGEQGRGFAVVATEVRALAGRSAEAAKQIKHLISDSVSRVEHGTTMVEQAGGTMAEVVHSIQDVTKLVGQISHASAEQNTNVLHVGQAITQLDQTTQKNASLVEATARAAEDLHHQAVELLATISSFKLPQNNTTALLESAPVLV